MNGPMWLGWGVVGLLAALSITFLLGKGVFLIAGYNTTPKKEREKYDERKLTRIMGIGLGIITIITAVDTAYGYELPKSINWLTPWGPLTVIAVMIVLANTITKKHKA